MSEYDVVIDTCDHGHKFAKLEGHPYRNGRPQCPNCMSEGLRKQAEVEDGMLKAILSFIPELKNEDELLVRRIWERAMRAGSRVRNPGEGTDIVTAVKRARSGDIVTRLKAPGRGFFVLEEVQLTEGCGCNMEDGRNSISHIDLVKCNDSGSILRSWTDQSPFPWSPEPADLVAEDWVVRRAV